MYVHNSSFITDFSCTSSLPARIKGRCTSYLKRRSKHGSRSRRFRSREEGYKDLSGSLAAAYTRYFQTTAFTRFATPAPDTTSPERGRSISSQLVRTALAG